MERLEVRFVSLFFVSVVWHGRCTRRPSAFVIWELVFDFLMELLGCLWEEIVDWITVTFGLVTNGTHFSKRSEFAVWLIYAFSVRGMGYFSFLPSGVCFVREVRLRLDSNSERGTNSDDEENSKDNSNNEANQVNDWKFIAFWLLGTKWLITAVKEAFSRGLAGLPDLLEIILHY